MSKAMYPGSFDPITKGHLDIITRASKSFDELDVVIMHNSSKKYAFSEKERLDMINKCVKDYPNVRVHIGDGLTVNYAKKIGCNCIVKGVRNIADYENESNQASININLDSSIETYLLISRPQYSFISSSLIKEIINNDGDIEKFIPKVIINDVEKKLKNND